MAGNTEKRIKAIYELDSTGFNKGLKGINTELKSNKEQLKLASAGIAAFGKDSDRLKGSQEALSKQVELTSKKMDLYKQSIEKTTTKMQDNIAKRDKLKESLDSANKKYEEAIKIYGKESNEAKKAKDEVARLSEEHKKAEGAVEGNAKKIQGYENNLTKANTEMVKAQGELKKVSAELKEQNSKWVSAGKAMVEHGEKLESAGKKMVGAGKTLTKGVTLPVIGIGAAALKAEIDWESAFAGVKKTVDGTTEQIKGLETGIKNMSKELPSSASEIAAVAESAGQLGIETDSILGFTKVIIDLGNATNLVGEEGASQLAKFANITKMSQKDFDRLGSTIVDLGNNSATTEADIVSMGLRLAGAGKQIGMSEANIMSFAAALSSVGIEAEAGGSAFSKVMVNMQLAVETSNGDLKNFAKVSGMTGEQFQKAFKEDATGALIAFIKGLENSKDKGESAIKVLDEMGISEVRMRDALLRASGAGDLFNDTIKIGSKAWEENTALTNEASQRYETTESQIKILRNEIVDLARDLGKDLLPMAKEGLIVAKDVIGRLKEMSPETRQNIIKFGLLAAAVGPVVGGLGSLVGGIGTTIKVGGKLSKKLGLVKAATEGVGLASGAASAGGVTGLAGGLGGLALAALPWVAGAAAVAGAGYLIHKRLSEDAIPTVDLFEDAVVTTSENVNAAYSGMAGMVESETIKINEGTKKAVGAYMDLDKGATDSLNNLYFNSIAITDKNKDELINKYAEMSTMINEGLQKKRDEDITNLSEFFATTNTLTDGEEALILQKTNEHYEERKGVTDIYQQQINDIVSNASENRRGITEEEYRTIADIQQRQKEQAIKALSENEIEAGVILERMKEYDGRVTAEQASKHINTLNESRDKAVKIANDEYDKRVAAILRTKSESTSMTQEQADKLIAEAGRQRDGIVEKAEDTRLTAIEKMRSMNKDLDTSVDTTTGNILSTWDKISRWWNGWKPEKKNFSYAVSGGGGGNNRATVSEQWTGSNHFKGGLTTLHERGEEIYDLPQGTKIYNAERSEQMAMNAAEKVAEKVASRMMKSFGSGNNNGEQTITLVTNLDSREISRAIYPHMSSQLAMGTMGRR